EKRQKRADVYSALFLTQPRRGLFDGESEVDNKFGFFVIATVTFIDGSAQCKADIVVVGIGDVEVAVAVQSRPVGILMFPVLETPVAFGQGQRIVAIVIRALYIIIIIKGN